MRTLPSLKVAWICNPQKWEQLQPQWMRLFDASASATPFQSPAWLMAWWRYFGNDQLRTIAFYEEDQLVGLFPLYVEVKNGGYRELKFVGTGISDYLGGLIAPGYECSVAKELFRSLVDRSQEWDFCNFEQLPLDSPIVECNGKTEFLRDAAGCLCAPLPPTVGEWRNSISRNLSRDIDYNTRRAQTLGSLAFECAMASNVGLFVQSFLALHAARWAVRDQTGVVIHPELPNFYHAAAAGLLAAGMLRFCLLTLNGRPVAGVCGFMHVERFYIYLTSFDPQFAKFSFGSLVISSAIEMAIHKGCREVDFLCGREPYKVRFGATEKRLFSFRCTAEAFRQKDLQVA